MKQHSAKDLRYAVDLLGTDQVTVVSQGVGAGVDDLSGHRLAQAQQVPEGTQSTHMVLLRYLDGVQLPKQGYVRLTDPDTGSVVLYVVDYVNDPRNPRPRVWLEVYCHLTRQR